MGDARTAQSPERRKAPGSKLEVSVALVLLMMIVVGRVCTAKPVQPLLNTGCGHLTTAWVR